MSFQKSTKTVGISSRILGKIWRSRRVGSSKSSWRVARYQDRFMITLFLLRLQPPDSVALASQRLLPPSLGLALLGCVRLEPAVMHGEQKLKNFKFAHGAKRPVWRMTDPGRKRHFDTKGPERAKYWSFDLGPRPFSPTFVGPRAVAQPLLRAQVERHR